MRTFFIILFSCVVISSAETPRFNGPNYIYDGSNIIDVGNYGAPYMFDWDLDGKKDLITGQFSSGYIRFYPNNNTDDNPQFNGFTYLDASGSRISVPSG